MLKTLQMKEVKNINQNFSLCNCKERIREALKFLRLYDAL